MASVQNNDLVPEKKVWVMRVMGYEGMDYEGVGCISALASGWPQGTK